MIYVDETATDIIDYVRISNFAQGNPGKSYSRAINYVIKMKLVYLSEGSFIEFTNENASELIGNRFIKVSLNGGTEYVFGKNGSVYSNLSELTVPSSLTGGVPSTDAIKVEYSSNQIDLLKNPEEGTPKMYLEIQAVPTPRASYLDLDALNGRLEPQLAGSSTPVVWTGYINETGARAASNSTAVPSTLDDYNYVIEGVGVGTITLSWNPTYLSLNQDFINKIIAEDPTNNTYNSAGSLTFKVNSNVISRYDTQFYRTAQALENYDTWGEVKSYITEPVFIPEAPTGP